jgi:hypothetical protein
MSVLDCGVYTNVALRAQQSGCFRLDESRAITEAKKTDVKWEQAYFSRKEVRAQSNAW